MAARTKMHGKDFVYDEVKKEWVKDKKKPLEIKACGIVKAKKTKTDDGAVVIVEYEDGEVLTHSLGDWRTIRAAKNFAPAPHKSK